MITMPAGLPKDYSICTVLSFFQLVTHVVVNLIQQGLTLVNRQETASPFIAKNVVAGGTAPSYKKKKKTTLYT